jgi:hypothetical protein
MFSLTLWGLYPKEKALGAHWIGGYVGPRTGLDDVESAKILSRMGIEPQPFGCPVRSQ